MSLKRYAAKRDGNERACISAFQSVGASVLQINETDAPDLLVAFGQRLFLFHVKQPGKKLTKGQEEWSRDWRGPKPITITNAFEGLQAIGVMEAK